MRTTTSVLRIALGAGLMSRLLQQPGDKPDTTALTTTRNGGRSPSKIIKPRRGSSVKQQEPSHTQHATAPDLPTDTPPRSWQVQVRTAVARCHADLTGHEQPGSHDNLIPQVELHLRAASKLASVRTGPIDAYQGRTAETAWSHVHQARSMLPLVLDRTALRSESAHARGLARRYLRSTDDRRTAIEDPDIAKRLLKPATEALEQTDADRHVMSAAVAAAYEVNDQRFVLLRGWRNRLYLLAGISLITTAVLLVVTERWSTLLPLGSTPAVAASAAALAAPAQAANPFMVALVGALGGFVTALAALRSSGPSTSAYSLTPALGLLKVPAGAVTALLGVMLWNSGTVPGLDPLPSTGAVAAAGLVLGASQELLTRLIDIRARAVETAAVKGGSIEDKPSSLVP